MQKITKQSLLELNAQIDPETLLSELGSANVERRADTVVAACPLEATGRGILTVEAEAHFATCSSSSCPAHQRRSLLWIYCKGTSTGLQEGAQELATQLGVLLEFEGEDSPDEEESRPIEIADAPDEIGPVISSSMVTEARRDDTGGGPVLHCPIIKGDCLEDDCRWWVVDWIEERNMYRKNCAVSLIAIALTDESLTKPKK